MAATKNARDIFLAVLGRAASDQAAYLDLACGGDAALRRRVEALLRADAEPGAFLSEATPGVSDGVTGTFAADDPSAGSAAPTANFPGKDEHVGAVLAGKYKLIEEIGEGGMGSVFLARQTEPVKRAVAVKVIKAGMDSRAVLARFEAERQALAMMDHPNIARVLDAGTTEGGRPFFVMELVKGTPITQFCDERKLTPRQRLELFVPVCQAIQHAHQKGVIHRDIKPNNVLVAMYDDRPVPKVIDFGVAKAAGQTLTDKTLMTGFGAVLGTPEYMSPEQANLNNLDIDTRSDVYSLGVLLYELLTGSTPVDRKSLGKAALLEILRIVREVEAPKPSAKLSTADTLPSVAANRGTEPAKLSRLMKGELDWVVLKALEKDRTRRYDTANGLARDIQRYLADEVVEARPPSTGYRLKKFVRRHKGQVLAASLVLVALLTGIAGTTIGLVRATRAAEAERLAKLDAEEQKANALQSADREAAERKKADAARAVAQAKEAEANAVVGFFADQVFVAARPKGQPGGLGKDVTLRAAIESSLPALTEGFKAQPLVESRLRYTLGPTFRFLGEAKAAAEQEERALAICSERLGPDDRLTLNIMNNLALSYTSLGRRRDALKLHEQTLAARRRVLGPDHSDTLQSMSNLLLEYAAVGRLPDAVRLCEESLAARRRVLPPDHPDVIQNMTHLASTYAQSGRMADALRLGEEALVGGRRVLSPDNPTLLNTLNCLANIYGELARHTDALRLREEKVTTSKRVLGPDHPDTLGALHDLANSYMSLHRYAEAAKLYEEVLTARRRVQGPDHPDTLLSMSGLGNSYYALGRHADALKLREELLTAQRRVLGPDHPHTLNSIGNLGISYTTVGRHADARKLFEELLAAFMRVLGPDHPGTLQSMNDLAQSLVELDRGAEALQLTDECLARAAGKVIDPTVVARAMDVRLRHFSKAADPAGCRATAEGWEKLDHRDFESLYAAACFRAVTAAVQTKAGGADRLARDDADRAMGWLTKAVAAGYTDRAHMTKDADLDALRGRMDFRTLLASLPEVAPIPRPAK